MVIDLTKTKRYYDKNEFEIQGVKHVKIECAGYSFFFFQIKCNVHKKMISFPFLKKKKKVTMKFHHQKNFKFFKKFVKIFSKRILEKQ